MIEQVGVVGAGTRGRGIIWALARSGIGVAFMEASQDLAKQSLQILSSELDHEIERWALTKSEKAAILSRVHLAEKFEELAQSCMVIDATPDDLQQKKELLAMLDRIMPPDQIFIANTSTLSITELAESTGRPGKFLGMHFMIPVNKRPLVEIVRGLKTSDQTTAQARELVEQMGKTAVQVFESPGFLTTRIILPFLNEAMHVVMEGAATAEDVDTAMKLAYDFPEGPLTLADNLGLDHVMTWMDQLFHDLGDLKYRPCPILRKMVRAGQLGIKTGRGFFHYDKFGKRVPAPVAAPESKRKEATA